MINLAKSTKTDQMKKKQKLQTSFRVSNNIESVHEQGLKCNIFFNTKKVPTGQKVYLMSGYQKGTNVNHETISKTKKTTKKEIRN